MLRAKTLEKNDEHRGYGQINEVELQQMNHLSLTSLIRSRLQNLRTGMTCKKFAASRVSWRLPISRLTLDVYMKSIMFFKPNFVTPCSLISLISCSLMPPGEGKQAERDEKMNG